MDYVGVMNNTKWNELRLAFYAMKPSPRWRTKDVSTGYVSDWDREWFYRFRVGGYDAILWLEVAADTPEERAAVLGVLKQVHVPGETTPRGFRILGYVRPGEPASYL